jgi:hypothetical protein
LAEWQVELIEPPNGVPLGAAEPARGPITAAIANAVFDGLGVRALMWSNNSTTSSKVPAKDVERSVPP